MPAHTPRPVVLTWALAALTAAPVSLAAAQRPVMVTTERPAQPSAHPLSDALRQSLQRAQRNIVGAAETMPADRYGYKPTPAQMSFGQQVLHVAEGNEAMCASISGAKAPAEARITATASKDTLVARLRRSFAFCTTALASLGDTDLAAQVPFFEGRTLSRAGLMMGLASNWSDHYSAMAIYLRLNGLLPPSAQRTPRRS